MKRIDPVTRTRRQFEAHADRLRREVVHLQITGADEKLLARREHDLADALRVVELFKRHEPPQMDLFPEALPR
jgi:hypothetical protein